jgi:hypothetical protein
MPVKKAVSALCLNPETVIFGSRVSLIPTCKGGKRGKGMDGHARLSSYRFTDSSTSFVFQGHTASQRT